MHKGSSLSPSHTLSDPAGEKLCRLQSPWFGSVPLGYLGESSHLCSLVQLQQQQKVSDIAAKTAALGPQVWEAATTGGSAAYCKRLLEEEPSERIGIALADVKRGTPGAMDLVRVARSKGDFPGKVPQLAHGPMFPALRSDALNHAEAACLQVAPNVFPSTVSPSAFSASKTILREESLLASLVQGTFTDWHLASMVHQWIQQDPKFCYGHTSGSEVTAKDRGAVMGSKGQEFMITTFLDTILGPWFRSPGLSAGRSGRNLGRLTFI